MGKNGRGRTTRPDSKEWGEKTIEKKNKGAGTKNTGKVQDVGKKTTPKSVSKPAQKGKASGRNK